jgi:aerobic carbon-monoxide dehydrogenase large subunit
MSQSGIGEAVRRTEDRRLVTGFGQYTDDVRAEGLLHAYFLRSPMAHARIVRLDAAAARRAPGVAAVFTGADIAAAGLRPLGSIVPMQNRDGTPMFAPPRPLIATDRVRYAGDTVAMVVADSVNAAKDAAELIEIDYEDLPLVADTEQAADPSAPVIWEGARSNIAVDWALGDEAAVEAGFAKAAHVTQLKLINNRVVVNPMEPRAIFAAFDGKSGRYEIMLGSQGVHMMRRLIAVSLGVEPEALHVRTADVGGGFGLKGILHPEYPLVPFAAKALGRPVKWTGERGDAFLTDAQGRDHVSEAAIAFDADFKILAIRIETIANLGAYPSMFGPMVPTLAAHGLHTGVYLCPALFNRVRCVYTNTTPTDAYRGAGRPEASYVLERLIDKAAREHGIAPDALRRRNFIPAASMPYKTPSGVPFDSGNFEETMGKALTRADWAGFPARKAAKIAAGKLYGIGLTYYVERTASGTEFARLVVGADGAVTFHAGTQPTGQGHETSWAQFVSEGLGVPFERVRVVMGDSDRLPAGGGTGGSRSLYMAKGAFDVALAALIEAGKAKAAAQLGVDTAQISFSAGRFQAAGRSLGLEELAKAAGGLEAGGTYQHQAPTLPNGCHICEVEIDPETGVYRIGRYTAVDDLGKVLNPLLVMGQMQGGIVQGLGQAMGEAAIHDPETGQLLTGSFMDYWMPRADVLPDFDLTFNEIPCTTNPLGVKGCGEAGTVAAPAAFVNAVVDALAPLGIAHVDMPITPLRLWDIIREAGFAGRSDLR